MRLFRFTMMVAALAAVVGAHAATFNVRDYGAKGDGVADDAPTIQSAINAAAAAGRGNTVLIPAGRYYVTRSAGGGRSAAFLTLPPSADTLTVKGDGPTTTVFLVGGGGSLFHADRCNDCAISGFSSDWKVLNVTQGRVVSVDVPAKTMTVTIDSGYSTPDAPVFSAAPGYQLTIRVLSPGRTTYLHNERLKVRSIAPSGANWLVSLLDPPAEEESGRRFFLLGNQGFEDGWNPIVDVNGVTNLTVSNIHGYASGGFAGGRDSRGTIRFDNVYCGPPPGSNRLGFYSGHQGHTRANVVMTNCAWVMSSDDDINELTALEHVLDHPRPDTITVFNSDDYQVGDTVSIWDYSNILAVHAKASARIMAIDKVGADRIELTLDHAVDIAKCGPLNVVDRSKNRYDGIDRVVDLSSGGAWKLVNCTFNSSFAHPLLIKSAQGIDIEGCHVYGSDMDGLECGMQAWWDEGPQSCNIVLKNNTFYDNDGMAAQLGIETEGTWSSASHDQENIDVEGNLFVSGGHRPVWCNVFPRGVGLGVGNAHSAVVRDNIFVDIPNANIVVYSSDKVNVAGNTFVYSHQRTFDTNNYPKSVNIDAGALIYVSGSQDVSLSNNLSYADGPHASKPIVVGSGVTGIIGAEDGVSSSGFRMLDFKRICVSDSAAVQTVSVPKAGDYRVVAMYSNGVAAGAPAFTLAPAAGHLIANGKSPIPVSFENNGVESPETPDLALVATVRLDPGDNKISVQADGGRVHIGKVFVLFPKGDK